MSLINNKERLYNNNTNTKKKLLSLLSQEQNQWITVSINILINTINDATNNQQITTTN